ncbi:MAG: hypothetical protein HGA25_11430, partial [Clostridiales bacterium]|nr:hypothetical protein [Clostridiales bacterium]
MASAQNCTLNANVDQTICANEVLTLSGNKGGLFAGAGTTTWSQVTGPSAIITSPNSLLTTVTGIQGGYTYKFRLSTECLDGSLIYDDVNIVVRLISLAAAGPDQGPFCPGSAGTLAGSNISGVETGAWSIPGSNDA